MSQSAAHADNKKLLWEKIKGIRIAMMTTHEPDGSLHSRPMATQEIEFDGDLWFFTQASTPKVEELQREHHVNIAYIGSDDNLFVSVSGTAQLIRDRQKIKDLWKPFFKAWFPKGEDDPDLALLKVRVTDAEYWDAPAGKMGALYSVVKGLATGGQDSSGENQKLHLQ
ncbi:pyridoxamine 5'-phosphate oxidase family protein [Tengunoibacter tsumagoiensis]|uniref:General stress protein n=1 Tax=Tengunoibacter tsumagoiensis TaxID=2014871 RepID=A0A402A1P0_9CHLR|nr:pyridoxamine 5'-phosphate oxidase family protein [Tengunoibacter tsumagoiensis]GCE13068.1 general stress protein [Tengunoibacter tsumagoiensis]